MLWKGRSLKSELLIANGSNTNYHSNQHQQFDSYNNSDDIFVNIAHAKELLPHSPHLPLQPQHRQVVGKVGVRGCKTLYFVLNHGQFTRRRCSRCVSQ